VAAVSRFLELTYSVELEVADDTTEAETDDYVSTTTSQIKRAVPGAVSVDLLDWDLS
jgi:hypothetical protein